MIAPHTFPALTLQSIAMLSVSVLTNAFMLYLTSQAAIVKGSPVTTSVIAVEAVLAALYALFAATWHNAVAKVLKIGVVALLLFWLKTNASVSR